MKSNFAFLCLFVLLTLSCTNNKTTSVAIVADSIASDSTATDNIKTQTTEIDQAKIGQPVVNPSAILKNFSSFWEYYSGRIKLYEDFSAKDTKGDKIDKGTFLKLLNTGSYFPLLVYAASAEPTYQLKKIPKNADPVIGAYMSQFSKNELAFYKMIGKDIPAFNFEDVNGKTYTSQNTKGKIVLFKCWFIGCVACVQEMPELNEIVERYKERNDILFISLATDPKLPLQKFLLKHQFDYATVPNQERYMTEKLKVNSYPTHFMIGKDGKLLKVLPDAGDVANALDDYFANQR